MTKAEALYNFFNSFGIDGYPETNVPDKAKLPYLTYESRIGMVGENIAIAIQLWYKTESEAVPNAKVEEIAEAIGLGGIQIRHDEGSIWIKRGTPFAIAQNAETDNTIKMRQININLEFI